MYECYHEMQMHAYTGFHLSIIDSYISYYLCFFGVEISNLTDFPWEGTAVASNFNRKCEALAVSGLADYGDEIDVIAPADILKQIFKMPYSKARLSIAVRRIGHTLVLNTGCVFDLLLTPFWCHD